MRRSAAPLFLLCLPLSAGCMDYSLWGINDKAPGEDTRDEICAPIERGIPSISLELGDSDWDNEDVCALVLESSNWNNTGGDNIEMHAQRLVDVSLYSAGPEPDDVRFVAANELSAFYSSRVGYDLTDIVNEATEDKAPTSDTGGGWGASWSDGELDGINSCLPDCDFKPFIEVLHPDPDDDACEEYIEDAELCFEFESDSSLAEHSEDASCAAGSGTFQLVAWELYNFDGDSASTVVFKAMQSSGTGTLTSAGQINTATLVSGGGYTVKMIKSDTPFRIDENDALVDANTLAVTLLTSGSPFAAEVMAGGAPLIIEEVSETSVMDYEVDLAWTCPSPELGTETSETQGYVLDLDDLDCDGSTKQKLTIRPGPLSNPTFFTVEAYGISFDKRKYPLTDAVGTGWDFDIKYADLSIEGTIISYDTTNGMSIEVDHVQWDGTNVCDAGTYTAEVES